MNLFGTDGIRRRVDDAFFTTDNLIRFGSAFATWALQHTKTPLKIGIITDTRDSGPHIKEGLIKGLQGHKVTVIDAGILPTTAAFIMREKLDCPYVLIISASHNKADDNGIKIIGPNGKLTDAEEAAIEKLFEFHKAPTTQNPQSSLQKAPDFPIQYLETLAAHFQPNFLEGRTIVLDCAHGATYTTAPTIFRAFGATVEAIGASPDGTNINDHCGSLFPEKIRQHVIGRPGVIGFAFDGDGDRVIMCTPDGRINDGDDILWLLLHNPEYQNIEAVVGSIVTNGGLEEALKAEHKKLIRAAVGDRNILAELIKNKLPLGGEPSGHIILMNSPARGDATFVALRIMETILSLKGPLPTFTKNAQVQLTINVPARPNLSTEPYEEQIRQLQSQLHNGRVVVRYSGTEPVLRVMVEAPSLQQAQQLADELAEKLFTTITKEYNAERSE